MPLMDSAALGLKLVRNRAEPRITIRDMAAQLGMPPSSYAAYEDPKKYKKRLLPFDLARRIAAILEPRGVSAMDVMQLAGVQLGDSIGLVATTEVLMVSASVAAGVWREQADWPAEDRYQLEVGPSPVAGAERFAVRMEGHSMDLTIPPGSDLECLRVAYGAIEPEPGDLVIVARQAHDLVETTCKRLDRDFDDWVLRMESSRPEFQDVIRLGRPSPEIYTDHEIRVLGIVIKAHQQHFRRRS